MRHSEYLILLRGQWCKGAVTEDIESATHRFRDWLAQNADNGRGGSRLKTRRVIASKRGTVTDGPFAEAKEFVDGGRLTAQASACNVRNENPASNPRVTRQQRLRKL